MMRRFIFIVFFFSLSCIEKKDSQAQDIVSGPDNKNEVFFRNRKIKSFHKAKRLMMQVYQSRMFTFYCGCRFFTDKTLDTKDCGYQPKRKSSRSKRMEWEHVVPAENFGRSFASWRDGHPKCKTAKKRYKGRRCARKIDKQFKFMEADLYNLYPAIGELNMLRSNYTLYMVAGEKREFGSCDFEVEDKLAEPRPSIRGDIARTYYYMDRAYPGHGIIGKSKRKLLAIWNQQDPVDEWECRRAAKIEQLQGNANEIVKPLCQKMSYLR